MVDSRGDDIALTIERQAAARRLLAEPLVTAASHPEDFALIYSHADYLVQRFRMLLGYELIINSHFARLVKVGTAAADPAGHPLLRASGAPFTPRAYAYLTLILAVVSDGGTDAPVPLGELAKGVRAAARDAGIRLGTDDRLAERRSFAAALVQLLQWRALVAVARSADGAAASDAADIVEALRGSAQGGSEIQFRVDPQITHWLLARLPQASRDVGGFLSGDVDAAASPPEAELAIRRIIAETPVVYRDALPEVYRGWLARHQWRAVGELGRFLGCDAEIRAEGLALVAPSDPQGSTFPVGTTGRDASRLLARLADELDPGPPARFVPIPPELLDAELEQLDGPADREEILAKLVEFGLLDRGTNGEWRLLAAAARYRPPSRDTDTS